MVLLETLSSGIVPAVLLVSVLILVLKIVELSRNNNDRVIKRMNNRVANEILNRKLAEEEKPLRASER